MRNLFPGYYRPTEEQFKHLWEKCIFVFDANMLLNVYRYSSNARERLFEILEKLNERIWIPHQAAYEYQKNRLNVILKQLQPYDELQENLATNIKNLRQKLDTYKKRHSLETYVNLESILKILDDANDQVCLILKNAKKGFPDLLNKDDFRENLDNLFDGKVGTPYSEKDLETHYKKADLRFQNQKPPGYKDKNKDKNKYGDVIVWFQIIDYAKDKQLPVIFVTDDDKEDWWLIEQGKTISPRPELSQEMHSEANVEFYMYTGDNFLQYAEDYLKLDKEPKIIEEATEVRIGNLHARLKKALKQASISTYQELLSGSALKNYLEAEAYKEFLSGSALNEYQKAETQEEE